MQASQPFEDSFSRCSQLSLARHAHYACQWQEDEEYLAQTSHKETQPERISQVSKRHTFEHTFTQTCKSRTIESDDSVVSRGSEFEGRAPGGMTLIEAPRRLCCLIPSPNAYRLSWPAESMQWSAREAQAAAGTSEGTFSHLYVMAEIRKSKLVIPWYLLVISRDLRGIFNWGPKHLI